jgi:hypothetical protein
MIQLPKITVLVYQLNISLIEFITDIDAQNVFPCVKQNPTCVLSSQRETSLRATALTTRRRLQKETRASDMENYIQNNAC